MRLDYAVFSERVSFVVLYHNFGDYTIEKTNKSFSKVFPPDLLSGSRARSCSQTAGLLIICCIYVLSFLFSQKE